MPSAGQEFDRQMKHGVDLARKISNILEDEPLLSCVTALAIELARLADQPEDVSQGITILRHHMWVFEKTLEVARRERRNAAK